MMSITLLLSDKANAKVEEEYIVPDAPVEMVTVVEDAPVYMVKAKKPVIKKAKKKDSYLSRQKTQVSEEDIKLLTLVTMAEAEGESEKGKRLVIDAILNRVDSKHFPNTVRGVVYQKNQFTSMWNGRINKCYVKKDIRRLVEEEINKRTNSKVIFFTAGRYGNYGKRMFREGNHYFSSYK